jgi:SprT protein
MVSALLNESPDGHLSSPPDNSVDFCSTANSIHQMADPVTITKLKSISTHSINDYCRLWGVEHIASDVVVGYSNRMTRSLGRTQPASKLIRLNALLQTKLNYLLEEVLCHELAHVAAYHLHGRSIRPHGPEWKALVRAAGFEPRVRIRLDIDLLREQNVKRYRHHCPVCNAARTARYRMTRWRCSRCIGAGLSGDLVIRREK